MNQLLNIFAEIIPDKINWEYVSKNYKLSDEFMERFSSQLNWDKLSRYQSLSVQFITKHIDKISWKFIPYKQELSEDFILKHKTKLIPHKQSLTFGQKLSRDFIENNFSLIYTQELGNKHYLETLPFDFFLKHIDRIPKSIIKRKIEADGITPDTYLMEYLGRGTIFNFKKIPSLEFIRQYPEKINWNKISKKENFEKHFTQNFIVEFCKRLTWINSSYEFQIPDSTVQAIIESGNGLQIYKTQNVGIDFLKKHQKEINKLPWLSYAINNPFINEKIVATFKDKIPLKNLVASLKKENFSLDFIRKHKNELNWGNLTNRYFKEIDAVISNEFEDYLNWEYVFHKDLEFSFMINHLDKIPSKGILLRNIDTFSFKEIHQLKNHINWNHMGLYHKINDAIIDEFSDYVNWKHISLRVKFNQHILEKYWHQLKWEMIATDRIDTSHLDFAPVINDVIQNNTFSRFPFLVYYNDRKYPIHF